MILRKNHQKVALCEAVGDARVQCLAVERQHQGIDQRSGERRALLHDARPSSDLQTNAGGRGTPEPGLANAPRDSDNGLQGDQGVCSERFVHKRVGPRQWRA